MARSFRWEVVEAHYRVSDRPNYRDQISFTLQVAQKDRTRFDKLTPKELPEGTRQGDRCWANFAATLNGWKDNGATYVPTKLAEFVAALFGVETQPRVADWIKNGGVWEGAEAEDIAEIEDGLEWFVGLEIIGAPMHPKPSASGRIYPRLKAFEAVGDREPDPDYAAAAAGKFDQVLQASGYPPLDPRSPAEQGVAEGADVAEKYDATGEPMQAEPDDEEAELERKLAEARARKAGKAEPVGAGAGQPRSYDQVFGPEAG